MKWALLHKTVFTLERIYHTIKLLMSKSEEKDSRGCQPLFNNVISGHQACDMIQLVMQSKGNVI